MWPVTGFTATATGVPWTPTATVNDCAAATVERETKAATNTSHTLGRSDFEVTKRVKTPGHALPPRLDSIIRSSGNRDCLWLRNFGYWLNQGFAQDSEHIFMHVPGQYCAPGRNSATRPKLRREPASPGGSVLGKQSQIPPGLPTRQNAN